MIAEHMAWLEKVEENYHRQHYIAPVYGRTTLAEPFAVYLAHAEELIAALRGALEDEYGRKVACAPRTVSIYGLPVSLDSAARHVGSMCHLLDLLVRQGSYARTNEIVPKRLFERMELPPVVRWEEL